MAIKLYRKVDSGVGEPLTTITEDQLQSLIDLLEEEHEGDRDYYIDRDLLDYMEEEGADAALLAVLKPLVPEDDGIEIEWRRE
ncbi:MAG: galactosyldiacylglycerol synthase [Deltaproteobacteria bacterium]|nr:galactosyldiacylglycerol synthase [Deltaproteobacteria bacterium]